MESLAHRIFPRATTTYKTAPADEPAVYLCNHAAAVGPALMTLYFEVPHKTWMISYAVDKKKAPNFYFHDFFWGRGRRCKWFWRFLSRVVALLLVPLLRLGDSINVYHDPRIADTMRESVEALVAGKSIVIFPESPTPYSEYVSTFHTGFAELARLYYGATGKCLSFYPVYAERQNRVISVGDPIKYDPTVPAREMRHTIAEYAQGEIDALARALPAHKPVPYLPPEWYRYYGEYADNLAEYWKLFE